MQRAEVIAAWQTWSPTGSNELSADLALAAPTDARADAVMEVFGAMVAPVRMPFRRTTAPTCRRVETIRGGRSG